MERRQGRGSWGGEAWEAKVVSVGSESGNRGAKTCSREFLRDCWGSPDLLRRSLGALGHSLSVLGRSLNALGRSLIVLGRTLGSI